MQKEVPPADWSSSRTGRRGAGGERKREEAEDAARALSVCSSLPLLHTTAGVNVSCQGASSYKECGLRILEFQSSRESLVFLLSSISCSRSESTRRRGKSEETMADMPFPCQACLPLRHIAAGRAYRGAARWTGHKTESVLCRITEER